MEHPDRSDSIVVEMPLFPLDVVLFPSMPLPLRILEERYKEMINRCLLENCPFGVVLITEGTDVGKGARTRDIGCAARVSHVERLADGRMNILVVGEQRFRILDTHETRPYRTGLTVAVQDAPWEETAALPLVDEVQLLLREFLSRSLALAGQSVERFDLPDEPELLSFTTACVLPIPNDEKQDLLENTDTAARLLAERSLLARGGSPGPGERGFGKSPAARTDNPIAIRRLPLRQLIGFGQHDFYGAGEAGFRVAGRGYRIGGGFGSGTGICHRHPRPAHSSSGTSLLPSPKASVSLRAMP